MPNETTSRSTRIALAAVLGLGLALRLGAMWLVDPTLPVADEAEYLYRSQSLAEGRELQGAGLRPPASIFYYAIFQWLGKPGLGAARLANVLAGTLVIGLAYAVGARAFDRRVALTAAAVIAVYPDFVFYSVSLWSEMLYLALTLGGLLFLTGPGGRGPAIGAAAAGLALGLSALTREVGLLLLPLGVAWIARAGGFPGTNRGKAAGLFAAVFAITLLPWTLRVNREEGPFTLVTRTTYLNLFLGNAPPAGDEDASGRWSIRAGTVFKRQREYMRSGRSPAEREAVARERAFRAIADRLPLWPIEKTVQMIPNLLTPNSLPVARLLGRPEDDGWSSRWAYRLTTDGTAFPRDGLARATIGLYGLLAIGGVGGWVLARRTPEGALLIAFAAAHVVPVIVAFGCSRFRIPLMPVLIFGAAFLMHYGGEAWRGAGPRRRAIAIGAAAATAIVIASKWDAVLTPQWG